MQKYLRLFIVIGLMFLVLGQKAHTNSVEWIIPLRTLKSAIDKKIKAIDTNPFFTTYETENEYIRVRYAAEKCVGHGWKVEPETVLSYERSPKTALKFDINDFPPDQFIKNAEHTDEYYTDVNQGLQYVVPVQPVKAIKSVRHAPVPKDSKLRCSGFPAYHLVSEVYIPYQTYEIKSIINYDIGQLGGFLYDLKKRPYVSGTIFIYSARNDKSNIIKMKHELQKYAFEIEEVPKGRLNIAWGGYRDINEIEAFIVHSDYPKPKARPRYPSY